MSEVRAGIEPVGLIGRAMRSATTASLQRYCWLALAIAALCAGAASLVSARSVRSRSGWARALWVRLRDEEAIEYGWITEWQQLGAWHIGMNYNCLVWYHGKQLRRFLIDREDGIANVELRSQRDPDSGIWIVRVVGTSREVVGALDRRSGQLVNFRGMRLDGRASLHQQEHIVYSSTDPDKPLPSWATRDGGVLLAQMPPGR